MADAVETMAYAGEVPWHGLGVEVEDNLTPHEMTVAAGLDWTVSSRPLAAPQTNDLDDKDFTLETDLHGIVRDSDNKILGPCGPKYVPVQNADALDFFTQFCDAGSMKMHTAGSLMGGKRIWALAELSGPNSKFSLKGDDETNGYVLLSSPHEWGRSLTVMFTAIRVVCNNTLTMALAGQGERFSHPHIRAFDNEAKERAVEALGLGNKRMAEYRQVAQVLQNAKYDVDKFNRFIAECFTPEAIKLDINENEYVDRDAFTRTAETVADLVGTQPGADLKSSRGTMWGLFNATTYYYDHMYGRDADSRVTNAFFGSNRAKKERALNTALKIAEAA